MIKTKIIYTITVVLDCGDSYDHSYYESKEIAIERLGQYKDDSDNIMFVRPLLLECENE